MRERANEDLRFLIESHGILYRNVAEQLGVSKEWFSRLMSIELSQERREQVRTIIDSLISEKVAIDEAVEKVRRERGTHGEREK